MRGREVDDVPVEVLDEPGGSTRTVELGRPRGRRRELVLVAVGIAVVVVVGIIGDGNGDDDRSTAAPTTTTTQRRTTTSARRPTTTKVPRSTTTTTWPQLIVGTGPLLPDLTGTELAVLDGQGVVWRIDVDTGNRCRAKPNRDSWFPWPGPIELDGELFVQSGAGTIAVDPRCEVRDTGLVLGDRWIAATTDEAIWVGTNDYEQRLIEVSVRTGEETGRVVDIPGGTSATVVGVGEDVVIGLSGEMTLVHGDGSTEGLGPGSPLGGTADRLLFVSCPQLRCALVTHELDSGRRTRFDVVPAAWEPLVFSRDGRWTRIPVSEDGQQRYVVLDLERGTTTKVSVTMHQAVFSSDGRWLIGHRGAGLLAVAIDDPGVELPLDIPISGIQNVVALRRP